LTRLLAVYDGSDNLIIRFEYADGRMPVAMTSGGSTYYLTYDQVGSLRVVTDGSGNVVKRVDYDSFGNIINDTNPTFRVPFGFAGGLYDRDAGLVRFGFRDYDPDVGRWTAKDLIFFAGGNTDIYGYCLNDPVNLIDLIGLGAFGDLVGVAASAATAALQRAAVITPLVANGVVTPVAAVLGELAFPSPTVSEEYERERLEHELFMREMDDYIRDIQRMIDEYERLDREFYDRLTGRYSPLCP